LLAEVKNLSINSLLNTIICASSSDFTIHFQNSQVANDFRYNSQYWSASKLTRWHHYYIHSRIQFWTLFMDSLDSPWNFIGENVFSSKIKW